MSPDLAADVARVLAALHEQKAWFRHGLTDQRIAELTELPLDRAIAARREAQEQGLVERSAEGTEMVAKLTPLGVARTRQNHAASA